MFFPLSFNSTNLSILSQNMLVAIHPSNLIPFKDIYTDKNKEAPKIQD